jgi:3',5'-cyclic AMP phosphodiesterase CpdA
MKRIMTNILICISSILIIVSLGGGCAYVQPRSESEEIISYAGFAEIDLSKNSFLLVGDTRDPSLWEFWSEKTEKVHKLLVEEMARLDPAFIVILGDLTANGSSRKEWQGFDYLNATLREKRIPYFPILGNHEVSGNVEVALQNYFQRFSYLDYKRWYSFTWKNVGFIMVDSNFSTLTQEENELQAQWYLNELERFDKDERLDYVIVCCHEPPFTNIKRGPNRKAKMYFADPFLRFKKTCLFFSGHTHSYERFQFAGKFFIVSGGGGAPRYKVMTDPTKRRYDDLFSGSELRFFHFCRIESRDGVLFYKVLRLEANDTFAIVDPLTIQPGPITFYH